ncbi:MAG: wyosine base formation protein [Phenylobacterium sp.]|nr:wyosine base formation protein [Phenylobacterium sp.]
MTVAQAGDLAPALADLREEVSALRRLVAGRSDAELARPTPFYGWRAQDVITHLTFVDRLARLAVTDPDRCAEAVAAMARGTAPRPGDAAGSQGSFDRLTAYAQQAIGTRPGSELVRLWLDGAEALAQAFEGEDGGRNLTWFGRPMKLATLIGARQMEVWAYGQDLFDLFRVRRQDTDRIRRVAEFAVKTFRFSFANRGLEAAPMPALALTAPSGAVWRWDSESGERITGSAADFCLVATQRRNVADTDLVVEGETARTWMQIAQCIAGAPHPSPAPGQRVWR